MVTKKLSRGILRSLLVISIMVAGIHATHAGSIIWTNSLGGNWSDANNWSPNSVPDTNDDVYISADGTYDVSLDTSTTINSLIVGGAGDGVATFHTGIS